MPDDPELFAKFLQELDPNPWSWLKKPEPLERGSPPPSDMYPTWNYSQMPVDQQLLERQVRGLIPIGGLGI